VESPTDSVTNGTSNNRAIFNSFNYQTNTVDVSCVLASASALSINDAQIVNVAVFR
jgi:hypothetical protein